VSIVKVLGLETEYGIIIRGSADPNPIAASSTLINAYVNELSRRVRWDFEDESPGRDARGFAREGSSPPEIETHLVNTVLTNGARYYVDHAHPEYSSPECSTAREVVLYDKAGELILARSIEAASRLLPPGQSLLVLKNNSDGKGNSYGTHENYLMDRAVPFARIVRHAMPHFVSRQIFTGAGKVGSEAPSTGGVDVDFQLTQRADFFEEEVGLETTLKRPIVNTRDEPHCNAQKYRRLHVIAGDANLSEVATFLKVGTSALVLSMIEDDWFARAGDRDFTLLSPVQAMRQVSYDLSLRRPIPLADGRSMTALEMQWEHLDLARKYAEDCGLDSVGGRDVGEEILTRWEHVLTGLESDPMTLATQLDWVANTGSSTGTATATAWSGQTPSWPPWTSSTTMSARSGPSTPGSTWNASSIPPKWSGPLPNPPRRREHTFGVGACSDGDHPSPPPTGTRWCSTSGSIHCVGFP
jgi:proteasome accessory factor PafA2